MIKVGIIADRIEARAARQGWRGCGFGGTGYTGVELLRLLAQHPQVELTVITSRGEAGKPVDLPFGAAFIVYTVGVHFEKFMQSEIRP